MTVTQQFPKGVCVCGRVCDARGLHAARMMLGRGVTMLGPRGSNVMAADS
jgi:hypothetical protein